jgi:hypothetical protein
MVVRITLGAANPEIAFQLKSQVQENIALCVVFQDAGNAGDNILTGQARILVGRESQIELVVQHGI